MSKKLIEVGDIFELRTNRGYAYMQCLRIPINKRRELELIRVYLKVHPNKETKLSMIQDNDFFYLNFGLQFAYNRKIVEKIGKVSIEPDFTPPRFFRTENMFGEGWQIIDSTNWMRETISDLTSEQMKLSPWGMWNDTLLIERLDEGWNLENWSN